VVDISPSVFVRGTAVVEVEVGNAVVGTFVVVMLTDVVDGSGTGVVDVAVVIVLVVSLCAVFVGVIGVAVVVMCGTNVVTVSSDGDVDSAANGADDNGVVSFTVSDVVDGTVGTEVTLCVSVVGRVAVVVCVMV
jgi:hypothetical protein